MKLVGLSRQIVLSMMANALSVTVLVILSSYVFFNLLSTYWPSSLEENGWIPTGPEWLWMIGATLAGLVLSILVAVNLSRRILVPLNSLADSIRRVAQGDLDARAVSGDRSLGEAAQLADDFNALAKQLQRVTEEQAFWKAAIAHELRTPVTILRGRLQGLAEGVFAPNKTLFLSLLAQVEGLTRLIEDLRVVSLAESGHLDLQVREANLAAEVDAVVEMVGDALQAAGQRTILDLDEQSVHCDPVRIRQALLALLDNVCRYAVAGQVRIRSHVKNGWRELSVEDDGPGMSDDFIPDVFSAFRRPKGSRSGGSGLGLAVVAAIAFAHGGRAECGTSASGGTVITLFWPNWPKHRQAGPSPGEEG